MSLLTLIHRIFTVFPFLRNQHWVRYLVTCVVMREATKRVPPRPYAFCQKTEYTTWPGLTDRKITGRHLPYPPAQKHRLPDIAELTTLFLRKEGEPKLCSRSSVLFAAFAQWFTDSFLRTSHGFAWNDDGSPVLDPDTNRPKRSPDRHALNDSNHEIDLCQIYGVNEDRTGLLRVEGERKRSHAGFLDFELHDGEMFPRRILSARSPAREKLPLEPRFASLHDERLLRVIFDGVDDNDAGEERSTKLFAVGLEHGNSTMGNSLFNIIFLREHNRVAKLIGDAYREEWKAGDDPEAFDERVFQTTRNVLMVMLLNIIICDYIPHLSPGNLPLTVVTGYAEKQSWYRTNRIAMEFNLLYRWHELVPDEFDFLSATGRGIKDYRHNNNWLIEHGIEPMIEGLSRQRAGQLTLGNLPRWLDGVLADTLTLMRASRLGSYQDYRKRFTGKAPQNFSEITKDPERLAALERAYPDGVESLEWYVGMYAEDHGDLHMMGELMLAMVAYDAFTQALTNPLLAKDIFNEQTFSAVGMEQIRNTLTLSDVVQRVVRRPVFCSFKAPREEESTAAVPAAGMQVPA